MEVNARCSRRLQYRDWLHQLEPINKSEDIWLQASRPELPDTRAPPLFSPRETVREAVIARQYLDFAPNAQSPTTDPRPQHCVPIPPNRNHARSFRNAATAARRPSPELRTRTVDCLHALEGPLDRQRLTFTYRRRTVRVYGARVSKRRPVVFVEPESGYAGWGDCGVQCEGQGYSDCAPCGPEIRRRVSSFQLPCEGRQRVDGSDAEQDTLERCTYRANANIAPEKRPSVFSPRVTTTSRTILSSTPKANRS
jgi:hypothetical protein